MIVEQIWTANAYRNFNYLIACKATGETLAIDPLDYEKCLATAKAKGWTITQILNTHEHRDHTGGNQQMVAATGAKVLAHANAKDKIPGMNRGLRAGEHVVVPRICDLEALAASSSGKIEIESLEEGRDGLILDNLVKAAVLTVYKERITPDQVRDVILAFEEGVVAHAGEDIASVEEARLVEMVPAWATTPSSNARITSRT